MKLLLTGAGGMVGQNFLEDRRSTNYTILAPRRSELNLSDLQAVRRYLADNKPDVIVHAAGRVGGIQANMANPVAFLVDNIDINRNLIGAAYEVGIPRILNLGSSCMYPRNGENPLREELVLTGEFEPTNEGYAIAKTMAARLCQYVNKEDASKQYKTLIPCNLYGRHDKFNPQHSHLIPAIIHKVHTARIEGAKTVEIWGDGTARREFMDAGDLVDFMYTALENFSKLPDLLNVGLGSDYSINEYYEAVARIVGFSGQFVHDLSKPVGMKQKLVSVSKLEQFGWKASISLDEGIKRAYDFYLKERGSK